MSALVTFFAVVMGLIIGAIALTIFYFGFIKIVFPDLPHYWKYKIRKKPHDEKDVTFLVELIEKGKNRENVIKEALLTNRYSMKKANELRYLFLEVEKSLKGGKEE